MEMRIFNIYLDGRAETEEEQLNRFLRSHRVLGVERHFVSDGPRSFWTVCVEYLSGAASSGGAAAPGGRRTKRIDYLEVLSPEDFAVFARLRETRKRLAQEDGVPPYAVFTDEQLAAMVTGKVTALSALKELPGVGEGKTKKYGAAMVAALTDNGDDS